MFQPEIEPEYCNMFAQCLACPTLIDKTQFKNHTMIIK